MGHQKLLACQIEDKFQLPFTDPLSGKQAVVVRLIEQMFLDPAYVARDV
jgi:hypothetical protein